MMPLSEKLRQLRGALPGLFMRAEYSAPVIRGNMKRVIIMKPKGEIFQEAIFVLRDDYFQRSGISRQELMQQAKAAADGCIGASMPPRRRALLPSALSAFALGAACTVLTLWFIGMI